MDRFSRSYEVDSESGHLVWTTSGLILDVVLHSVYTDLPALRTSEVACENGLGARTTLLHAQ